MTNFKDYSTSTTFQKNKNSKGSKILKGHNIKKLIEKNHKYSNSGQK